MRVIVLGAGGAHKTETAIARGVRTIGHACRHVNVVGWTRYLKGLAQPAVRRLVDSFEPDMLVVTRPAIRLGADRLRALIRGRRSAFWYFDLAGQPFPDALALGRCVDTMFVTTLSQVARYQTAGVPLVLYLPQGMDPATDHPVTRAPRRYVCDVSFVGSGHYPFRHDLLRAVAVASRMQIRGPGWEHAPADLPVRGGPVWTTRFAQVVRGAAISLGAHAVPEHARERGGGASNRMWKVLGCEGFYLGAYVEGIEAFARDGEHCAWYRDRAEAVALVRHYLADPASRARIAQAGRAHALAHHTYAHRVPYLLEGRGYTST
ncbi:MAG TPA: glycosyltransferase [Gemmatimonadales bacterium]|nr:glycosyltransferase [Gemmatimonadales bacterium]